MFPYNDAQTQLDLHNQHADELRRAAAAHRLAQSVPGTRRHLFRRRPRPVRAPMAS